MLSVIMLSVIMLSVIMLSVIMLSVIKLSVALPFGMASMTKKVFFTRLPSRRGDRVNCTKHLNLNPSAAKVFFSSSRVEVISVVP